MDFLVYTIGLILLLRLCWIFHVLSTIIFRFLLNHPRWMSDSNDINDLIDYKIYKKLVKSLKNTISYISLMNV